MPGESNGANQVRGQAAVYDRVNQQILEALAKGVVPWRQPWTAPAAFLHRNARTGHPYRGLNIFLLALQQAASGYASPLWLTYRQAFEAGGYVKPLERGTTVIFWKPIPRDPKAPGREDDEEAEDAPRRSYPTLRYYTVFNVAQCAELRPERLQPVDNAQRFTFSPLEQGDRIVGGYLGGPEIVHGGGLACYDRVRDRVTLPRPEDFHSVPQYYAALFHELAHSTGHEKRLNRRTINGFRHYGDDLYAREELVAEMGSAFLQGQAGIDGLLPASASYIAGWMRRIQNEPKLLVVAAGQAQRASEWILGPGQRPPPPTTPAPAAAGVEEAA